MNVAYKLSIFISLLGEKFHPWGTFGNWTGKPSNAFPLNHPESVLQLEGLLESKKNRWKGNVVFKGTISQ